MSETSMMVEDINKLNYFNYNKNKEKIIIKRNSSIDLVRILGMYAIIIHHVLIKGKLLKKYKRYNALILINIMCHWHVSSFALISGIVSHNRNKYSNLLFLWFCVFFYSIIIYIFFYLFKLNTYNSNILYHLFPVIFYKYWYFSEYFGMYLFLPLISKGIFFSNKKELKTIIITTLGIFIVWKDFMNYKFDTFKNDSGYSVLCLLNLYIVGAYLEKYIINIKRKNIFFCIICIILYICTSLLTYYLAIYNRNNKVN